MEEKLTLTNEWDKTFPKSQKVDHCKIPLQNHLSQPLWNYTYSRYVHSKKHKWQDAGNCSKRTFRSGKGTVLRTLRTDYGGKRIFDNCI